MKTKYMRKGQSITTILADDEGNDISTNNDYGSINKAKKASRKLQQSEGGLGCGVLLAA